MGKKEGVDLGGVRARGDYDQIARLKKFSKTKR